MINLLLMVACQVHALGLRGHPRMAFENDEEDD